MHLEARRDAAPNGRMSNPRHDDRRTGGSPYHEREGLMPDNTMKNVNSPKQNDRATDKVEDLPQQPIPDRDLQAIKGGVHPEPKRNER